MQVKFVMESRHAARSTGGRSKPELRWMRPQLPKLVHTAVNTAHLPSSSVRSHFRPWPGIVICRELTLQSTANVRADARSSIS